MNAKKKIIFHFYITKNVINSKISNLHFKCLSKYSGVFDEALFILSINDISRTDLINYVKKRLIDCGFNKNVTFETVQNTPLRESATFYEYIASKLESIQELVFFGHSKGVGNEIEGKANESVVEWIKAAYFLNLQYISEVDSLLIEKPYSLSYGALKCSWDEIDNKNKWIYSGTFFWLNCQRLWRYLNKNGIEIKAPVDRYYSELFCGECIPLNRESVSHDAYYLYGDGCQYWYNNSFVYIDYFLCEEQDKENYKNFKNEIDNEE